MKVSILSLLILVSVSAGAAEKAYLVKGKEVSPGEAILASLKGETEVYKCTQVKAKASKKTGNISLKAADSD